MDRHERLDRFLLDLNRLADETAPESRGAFVKSLSATSVIGALDPARKT